MLSFIKLWLKDASLMYVAGIGIGIGIGKHQSVINVKKGSGSGRIDLTRHHHPTSSFYHTNIDIGWISNF